MKRSFGLDVIRCFAVLFIVCVHFFLNTSFYTVPFEGANMLFQAALRWVFIICVPLFLILSGYLQSKKALYENYYEDMTPMLGIYILYSILSIAVRTLYFKEYRTIMEWIADVMAFRANGYSWYINMYIGLYLLIPFLNILFNNIKSRREHNILLLTMIFTTGLPGFFNNAPEHIKFLHFPDWWLPLYPITYYFIGAYIREYPLKLNKLLAAVLFVLLVAFETLITSQFSKGRIFYNGVGDYGSILILIQAVMFFLILYDIDTNSKGLKSLCAAISSAALDIFLCSYISDRIVYSFVMAKLFISQQQIIFYFVFIIAATFTLSTVVALTRISLLRTIYIVKKLYRHKIK
ncbi:MAG TPA: acyltransferase family protein [Candidatus Nitrosocosmicus sp.]|nr:acyltransferase family protein [Candidatus Nitrosocosmicus sp.]